MLADIISWAETYGWKAALGIFLAVSLYGFYDKYLSYWFSKKLRTEELEQPVGDDHEFNEKRKNDLKNQEFFSNIHFKMNVDIMSEDYSEDPVRSQLFKDILVILYKCYYDSMVNFIRVIDADWDKDTWAKTLNKEMINTIRDFKEKALAHEIPDEAIKRFMLWYAPYVQQVYFYIRKIRGMGNRNAIENTNTFLLLLELILTNVTSDIQKYTVFNGKLDGLEYKGQIIGE